MRWFKSSVGDSLEDKVYVTVFRVKRERETKR